MTNLYEELKNNHQIEVNDFPMFFAFSEDQFNEGMIKLGLQPNEKEKIVSSGFGGFILKTNLDAYKDMFNKQEQEMKTAITNSDQFIFDMFNYELSNHEYTYTYEIDDTISALGLTIEEIEANERLLEGLKKACAYQRSNDN